MQFSFIAFFCALFRIVVALPMLPDSLSIRHTTDWMRSQVSEIWNFPNGTWVESLAVRGNGQILTTILSSSQVYQVDPSKKTPATLVHTFESFRGCLGIVELQPDIFYVVVGNVTSQVFPDTAGSFTVWELDMRKFVPGRAPATVTKKATFPQSVFLNGITTINPFSSSILLIADSGAGAVWSLDTSTGRIAKASSDPRLAPTNGTRPLGVNGVKVHQGTLFFTNFNQQIFASADIGPQGDLQSPAKILATELDGVDDFQLDVHGDAFFTGNDQLRYYRFGGNNVSVLSRDPLLEGSTAVQFGRRPSDSRSLYVSTFGPIEQYESGTRAGPGRIVRVDLTVSKGQRVVFR